MLIAFLPTFLRVANIIYISFPFPFMRGHKFLEHTADVKAEAWGRNYAEALEEAALALMETMADIRKIKRGGKKIKIKEKAPNLDEAVVFSLSDILSEAEINDLFFYECKVKRFEKVGGGSGASK